MTQSKKVFIIGAGSIDHSVRIAEECINIANLPADVEIVHARSIEDVPLTDRTQIQSHAIITFPITMRPELPPIFYERKTKGWERPYKFHK